MTLKINPLIRTSVSHLGRVCGPSAVRWLVVGTAIGAFGLAAPVALVAIDSIDGCPRRRFAHVFKEVLKPQPAFADRDALSSVILIHGVERIATALKHSHPSSMERGVGPAVRGLSFHRHRVCKTPATARMTGTHMTKTDGGGGATSALADAKDSAFVSEGALDSEVSMFFVNEG